MKLRKGEWVVRDITMSAASLLVETHHYAKSASKNAVALHGLFRRDDKWGKCYGVAWWLPLPSKAAAQFFHKDWQNVLALSRMVLVPEAPKNAASFLLARSIKMLPARYHTLATYADEWAGHTGGVYKAANWTYLGINDGKPRWINAGGCLVSPRNGRRTLTKAQMEAAGYTLLGYFKAHRYVYYRHEPSKADSPVQLQLFQVG